MLALMRDPQVPGDLRLEMAVAAAPFVHARPQSARPNRPDPWDLRDRLGDSGDLKFRRLDRKLIADGNEGLSPLDFLLGIMDDPAATPRERIKAARIAARYKHAHAGGPEAPTMIVGEDKFGFKVDPELARAERDDSLRERRLGVFKKRSAEGIAAEPELEQIGKRRAERLALVKFPAGYTYDDREADQKRLRELSSKRLSRKKLTPEEDAEEAHLAVRVLTPMPAVAPAPAVTFAQLLRDDFPVKRIYRLEVRRFDQKLTPAEADELEELRRQYPERAERYRNLVVRRLSEYYARRDYTRRLGFDPGPDEGWPLI
jgi:hypothetical protein